MSRGSGIPWPGSFTVLLLMKVILPQAARLGSAEFVQFWALTRGPLQAQVVRSAISRSATGRRSETSHRPRVSAKTRPRLGRCRGPPLAASRPPSQSTAPRPTACSSHAWRAGLAMPPPPAAPRRARPRREPQVQAGEWAAAASPALAGPQGRVSGRWSSVSARPPPHT